MMHIKAYLSKFGQEPNVKMDVRMEFQLDVKLKLVSTSITDRCKIRRVIGDLRFMDKSTSISDRCVKRC